MVIEHSSQIEQSSLYFIRLIFGLFCIMLLFQFNYKEGMKKQATPASSNGVIPQQYYDEPLPTTEERVCLSLKVLSALVKDHTSDIMIETLAGISWVEGYVIDEKNNDVILFGRSIPDRQPLHLDDLVVNLRNVWNHDEQPYCSLDPQSQDILNFNRLVSQTTQFNSIEQIRRFYGQVRQIWGPQIVVVGGVPFNSRHAHTMIDADYYMKKLSQGLEEFPGIPSCLDLMIQNDDKSQLSSMSMSRFWFHIAEENPTFQESDDIVLVENCFVTLLTEKQRATIDGSLYDSGEEDQISETFAKMMSDKFQLAATEVRYFADLENLYRLSALLRAMHLRMAVKKADLNINFLLKHYSYCEETKMDPTYPGLTNKKEITKRSQDANYFYEYYLFPMVCGGVSMEMTMNNQRFEKINNWKLDQLAELVLNSRPDKTSLSWVIQP